MVAVAAVEVSVVVIADIVLVAVTSAVSVSVSELICVAWTSISVVEITKFVAVAGTVRVLVCVMVATTVFIAHGGCVSMQEQAVLRIFFACTVRTDRRDA